MLAAAGFDLVHAFDPRALAAHPALAALAGPEPRGLLVGNTRALWAPFAAARPALAALADPLDHYAELHIGAAFPGARIIYAHARPVVPLAPIAILTGLAAQAPNHFLIHPVFGPWFALRAAVLLDGPRPPARAPIAQPCACVAGCVQPGVGNWTARRDACSLRAYRYSDEQVRFHDAGALRTMRG